MLCNKEDIARNLDDKIRFQEDPDGKSHLNWSRDGRRRGEEEEGVPAAPIGWVFCAMIGFLFKGYLVPIEHRLGAFLS